MLITIKPVEKPIANITAIAESVGAIFFLRIYDIVNTANSETPKAVSNGLMPRNSPKAMPPKAVCDSPSPIIASFFKTKNKPTLAHATAAITPPIRAF